MAQMYIGNDGNRYFNNPTRNNAIDDRNQYDVSNPYYNAYVNGGTAVQNATKTPTVYNATNALTNNWSSQRIIGKKDPKKPGSGSPNYYNLLANYYKQQNDAAKKAALDSIEARLKANTGLYNAQLENSDNAYQKLINQNEVNRYRTQASIREALANRGQLDTGLGRQEMLNATANNTSNLNNIMLERQSARNDIQNLIAQLNANANDERANVEATYTQALKDWVAKQK